MIFADNLFIYYHLRQSENGFVIFVYVQTSNQGKQHKTKIRNDERFGEDIEIIVRALNVWAY